MMTAATASSSDPSPVVICHNCGKEGHYKSGCAIPGKVHGKAKKAGAEAGQNKKKAGGGTGGQTWCSGHKKTTPSDTEYYVQGAPRAQTTAGTHTAAELSVDTDERSTINFDDDIAKGFKF